mmetsp:Transcript_2057/g.3901  ORF Transcript_2057/g.3901 Transcript_2057/m.3901 type:complete len:908 (+) Transcript_2057:166-2889(+)
MKRPGDKQSPFIQRANKLQKTVTFSLPHQSPPPSLVSNSNTSSPSTKSNLNITMTGGNHAQPQSSRSHGDNHSTTMDNTNHNPSRRASILRSTSTSNSSAASPRFTFDFVDDTSLGTSTIASKKSYNSSPNNRRGSKLSPTRLDARYSSRLPPSYGHGYSPSHRSYTSANNEEELKRNLFGASEEGNTNSGAMAMDESSDDFMELSSSRPGTPNSRNGPGTPNSQQRSSSHHSHSQRTPNSSASPRNRVWGLSAYSPANRSVLTNHTSGTTATASSARSASTFLTSSPRKRGMLTGVTSPLSGNLSHASVCSSVASSPANSSPGGAMMVDYEQRGAGDRFIPSRALSNFNFELLGSGNASNANGGNGGNGVAGVEDGDLAPAPSFGATMMGGGTIVDATPATATPGATTATRTTSPTGNDGQPAIASTFSDDAASNDGAAERHDATNRQPLLYDALLRSEMLGENIDPAMHSIQSPTGLIHHNSPGSGGDGRISNVVTPFRERSNNLRFSPSRQFYQNGVYSAGNRNVRQQENSSIVNSFGLMPVSMSPNQRTNLGSYTERCKRKIAKVPTKVLDAPALQDDFYLNLVDWSSQNVLAVGLGSCVYLWSAATSRVTQLCDLSSTEDAVTSVAWSEGGKHLAIGSTRGDVQLWDAPAQKLVRTMTGHSARVGALSWKLAGGGNGGGGTGHTSSLLASGSRDRLIHLRDPRSDNPYEMRLCGHKQEVCGLKWSFDERSMLASGGNDNKLLVWDVKKHTQPYHTFADHTAAVKAIAWSPHQHGLLGSGGGTADRCIRFWNCLTGHGINCIDTGSQVCNLAFSKNCNELVSTHGYSLNQIVVWKYPSMQKIATLTGHTYRVLYLALSPDGSTIVTGAGDETLRFWQVFPGPQKENKAGGLLFPAGMSGSVIR